VHDSFGVRRFQAVGNLDAQIDHFRRIHGPAGDTVLQSLALEQLHDDEGPSIVFVDVVNRADIGMIQRGGGAGFPPESLDGLGILRDFIGQKFQRHAAAEPGVFGFENYAHSTPAQLFQQFVMRDGFFRHSAGSSGSAKDEPYFSILKPGCQRGARAGGFLRLQSLGGFATIRCELPGHAERAAQGQYR